MGLKKKSLLNHPPPVDSDDNSFDSDSESEKIISVPESEPESESADDFVVKPNNSNRKFLDDEEKEEEEEEECEQGKNKSKTMKKDTTTTNTFVFSPDSPKRKIQDSVEDRKKSKKTPNNTTVTKADISVKREIQGSEEDENKNQNKSAKMKTTRGSNGGSARLFSDEDEIAILEKLSEYLSEKRMDAAEFHTFVSESLSFEASKEQVSEKIRRLKKKYLDAFASGGLASSATPHEVERFEISKKIWGIADKTQSTTSSEKTITVAEFPRIFESVKLLRAPIGSKSLARTMGDLISEIPNSKAKMLEKKYEELWVDEVELSILTSEFYQEMHSLILFAIKSEH